MSTLPFTYVIGLEVHVELATATKMFCRCLNAPFLAEPNEHTCPICMGLPGTLPVPNLEAVRKTIIIGKALGSTIPQFSKFDRKHYFYPDLPKGYQISQYDLPLCMGGELALPESEKVIRFERVHLEEDAGKLLHGAEPGYSLVDLNRAGVPLAEMVTKPDLSSPEEARRFLQELRLLIRTIGVSEADMEKGQLRCDVNVSIKFSDEGTEVWTPVTEIKNVNSTRAVERSLYVEGQRLYDEWLANGPIRQRTFKLTAGWNEDSETITINRTKEGASDYRYFPEPDIPPLRIYDLPDLNPEQIVLPELPTTRRARYLALGVLSADIETLFSNESLGTYFEILLQQSGVSAKTAASWLINLPSLTSLTPGTCAQLLSFSEDGTLAFSRLRQAGEVAFEALKNSNDIEATLTSLQLLQRHDASVVQSAIVEVLAAHPDVVAQYRNGEHKVLGFLIGQVLKQTRGQAEAAKVQAAVLEALQ